MEARRGRVESIVEWALAAACILGTVAIGSSVIREFRDVTAATPVIAREAPVLAAPAGIPAGAVSVPLLPLPDGKAVYLGDSLSQIAERFGRQAEVGTQSVERATHGERLTRFYEHAGSRFILVFEPREPDAEPKVAAIYRQS
jgi:hypothetical protein